MAYERIVVPSEGKRIDIDQNGNLQVPDNPIVCFIEGDGTGPDIWAASQPVLDEAVAKAYGGQKKIVWMEVYAGDKANGVYNEIVWLPQETLDAIDDYMVALKGPLTTPVGGGIRSINVALRQRLDLYACVRPVRYFNGVPSPVRQPELVDMVIFRENTEDIYAGIEFEEGTDEAERFKQIFSEAFGERYAKVRFPDTAGFGIKPVSQEGTDRLVRASIQYALDNGRESVTLVHKANILKYTQGLFLEVGRNVAAEYEGRVEFDDKIVDATAMQLALDPYRFDVIVTENMFGDILSDQVAGLIGGLGFAPGANLGERAAIFEAVHGSAPDIAGKGIANPTSLLLAGCLLLDHLEEREVAARIRAALHRTLQEGAGYTPDLGGSAGTAEFAGAVIERLDAAGDAAGE